MIISFYIPHLDCLYTVCELGDQSLAQWISKRNAGENAVIDREQVYSIFLDICSGVKYLHGTSNPEENSAILHGNLKPSNVLLFKNGSVKVSDVGGIVDPTSTNPSNSSQLSMYLPPSLEPDVGKTQVDVFSLGEYFVISR